MLRIALCALVGLLGSTLPVRADAPGRPGVVAYDQDLDAAFPALARPEEARRLHALRDRPAERERFLHRFWAARGVAPVAGDAGSVPSDAWFRARRQHRRFLDARRRFEHLEADPARAFLFAGAPAREVAFGGCRGVVRPMRLWWYDRWQARDLLGDVAPDDGFWIVFVRDYGHPGSFRSWSPADGIDALQEDDAVYRRDRLQQVLDLARRERCFRHGATEEARVTAALTTAVSLERLGRWARRDMPPARWLRAWQAPADRGTEIVAEGAGDPDGVLFRLPGVSLDLRARSPGAEPGTDAGSDATGLHETLVRGRLTVPVAYLRRTGGEVFDRLVVRGESLRLGYPLDRFEHVFHLVGRPPADEVHLDVWRRLRAGGLELRLRLEDDTGRALLRVERRFQVGRTAGQAIADARARAMAADGTVGRAAGRTETVSALSRERVVSLVEFPSLEILSPGVAQAGRVEIRTRVRGEVARVDFRLDGRAAGADDRPPFTVTVDLGAEPAPHLVEAVGHDAAGLPVVRHALRLDPGPRPFDLRLRIEGDRVRARVSVPPGRTLRHVRVLLGDRPLATLEDPPFEVVLPADERMAAGFVRAEAVLDDGRATEDLALLATADTTGVDRVDVRLVEVYATVTDGRGRPVRGLGSEAFRILDEGVSRQPSRFAVVADLPLRVALLMDTSSSMRRRLDAAVRSARRFFATVLREDDRAALLTFDHDLDLRVPFTSDPARLALGAAGPESAGGTRLHDALVWALGAFAGAEPESDDDTVGADHIVPDAATSARHALVLLSDGRDVGSTSPFDRVVQAAVDGGVAVYPILLSVDDAGTRADLERLARATGGRTFTLRAARPTDGLDRELDRIYGRIEEDLRSQYLLAFPAEGPPQGTFRRLDVSVDGGHRVRSIRGYYH